MWRLKEGARCTLDGLLARPGSVRFGPFVLVFLENFLTAIPSAGTQGPIGRPIISLSLSQVQTPGVGALGGDILQTRTCQLAYFMVTGSGLLGAWRGGRQCRASMFMRGWGVRGKGGPIRVRVVDLAGHLGPRTLLSPPDRGIHTTHQDHVSLPDR